MATQKDEFLTDVRQTKELARSSRISSFLSEHLVSFSESQPDAFLPDTSRPIRTSPVFLVLSEHLSSGNLFILFIFLVDICCSLAIQNNTLLPGSYGVFTPQRRILGDCCYFV